MLYRGFIVIVLLAILLHSTRADEPTTLPARTDPFGITYLHPTHTGGREWFANWNNHHSRSFTNAIDPDDKWFDTDHGDGNYSIDGNGTLTATGPVVRMYVHDPALQFEWAENLEITIYVTRISETKHVSYAGLQIFARTNHGTTAPETKNLCDTRGYGAKICDDGRFELEKETCHGSNNGTPDVATQTPWKELPKNAPIGIKYILRNSDHDTKVHLEIYRDLTNGKNGGDWQKMTEFTDDGTNFGVASTPAKKSLDPALPLLYAKVLPDSESKKPMISVYFRHEYATMQYSRASIRQIDPLP